MSKKEFHSSGTTPTAIFYWDSFFLFCFVLFCFSSIKDPITDYQLEIIKRLFIAMKNNYVKYVRFLLGKWGTTMMMMIIIIIMHALVQHLNLLYSDALLGEPRRWMLMHIWYRSSSVIYWISLFLQEPLLSFQLSHGIAALNLGECDFFKLPCHISIWKFFYSFFFSLLPSRLGLSWRNDGSNR